MNRASVLSTADLCFRIDAVENKRFHSCQLKTDVLICVYVFFSLSPPALFPANSNSFSLPFLSFPVVNVRIARVRNFIIVN